MFHSTQHEIYIRIYSHNELYNCIWKQNVLIYITPVTWVALSCGNVPICKYHSSFKRGLNSHCLCPLWAPSTRQLSHMFTSKSSMSLQILQVTNLSALYPDSPPCPYEPAAYWHPNMSSSSSLSGHNSALMRSSQVYIPARNAEILRLIYQASVGIEQH